MTPELVKLLAVRPRGQVLVEVMELSHSAFSQTYYLVRNYVSGGQINIKLETGVTVTALCVPSRIQWARSKTNMDQVHRIVIQDLNQIVREEERRVPLSSDEPIRCVLRSYVSTDLNTVADGPYELEVTSIDYDKKGCSFEAKPPNTNASGTGERYTVARFPCLRGFTQTS